MSLKLGEFHHSSCLENQNTEPAKRSVPSTKNQVPFVDEDKCDGASPCSPCLSYGRGCDREGIDMRRRMGKYPAASVRESLEFLQGNEAQDSSSPSPNDLSLRLARLERLMHMVASRSISDAESRVVCDSNENENENEAAIVTGCQVKKSIEANLDEVEERLKQYLHSSHPDLLPPAMPSPALTPEPLQDDISQLHEPSGLRTTLSVYGIDADRSQWDKFLSVFCDEIHIMYPFLHLPSLYAHYNLMWEVLNADRIPGLEVPNDEDDQILTCQVLLCLAIGRCTASPRISQEDGRHSAGWSLYRAAMTFLGDIMDCSEGCISQIRFLQGLQLIVIYLFRLDIIGKAERLLALAVSHAYSLHLHTASSAVGGNDNQKREMCRRLWWCLYLLDRRLAIETRRPFLIQDANITAPLPQIIPDDISQCDESTASCGESSSAPLQAVDSITFLTAMITYSKTLGRTWESIYSPNSSNCRQREMENHLEALISQAQKDIPSQFAYNAMEGPCINYQDASWWLVKQQTLMQVRWLSLRLMIHTSMLQKLRSSHTEKIASFENEVISMSLSSKVIELFLQIPEQKDIFTFPFFHYLITAAIISLGLLIKEPAFRLKYGSITLRAVQLLESYCTRTWVSGKTIRNVSRLGSMIFQVLRQGNMEYSQLSNESLTEQSTQSEVSIHQPQRDEGSTQFLFHALPTDWSSLTLRDFQFEQGALRFDATEGPIPSMYDNGDISGHFLSHPHEPVGAEPTIRSGHQTIAGQMEWLEDLFGDYLDPDLIIRPQS
ncbi:uncharacterized protein N7483_006652 [Penicillium malachiteum]|uniref:uncharacterized protein n=1 Tax=Penicillium malachiteum TaxID=1324776 RepID=UPI0025474894|nr:uncharacterized protein N7483_006652 [Penicillium malachiteum]KAJ5725295.1 hypothetical protein N7483_006652 [Penicillium malachiteum]